MVLIALHGDPGAGKDAVGEILVRNHGFTRFAFADQLKRMCEALDPIVTYRIDHQLIAELDGRSVNDSGLTFLPVRLREVVGRYGWEEAKRRYPEVRRTQQYLGTEVIRDFVSETFWADEVDRDVRGFQLAVITDLRFETEYAMVARLGGTVWQIDRPGNPHHRPSTHRSESWHPPAAVTVTNDGTLDDLAETVRMLRSMSARA